MASYVARSLDGQVARPDVAACVSSGVFDVCLEIMVAFEACGTNGLQTVSGPGLYSAISVVVRCAWYPGCEGKIRGVVSALAFCLENSIDVVPESGQTTGSLAAQLCAPPASHDLWTPACVSTLLWYQAELRRLRCWAGMCRL